MTTRRRLLLAVVVVAAIIGCDRMSKNVASAALKDAGRRSYLGDTVRLEYTENKGAFLGLGSRLGERTRFWVLTVATGVFLLALSGAIAVSRSASALDLAAWSLLLGGGASNLLDRALRDGAVVDFLNVGVGPLRTGVFNVADVAITSAVVLLVIGRRRAERGP